MNKSIRVLLVALLCAVGTMAISPATASAQEKGSSGSPIGVSKKLGVGLGGGTYVSGISAKQYLGESSAIQIAGGLAYAGFGAEAQYIIKEINLTSFSLAELDLALGAGAGFATVSYAYGSWMVVGPHANIGFSWKFKDFPLEITGAYRPGYYFAIGAGNLGSSYTAGGLGLGYGGGAIRWYF